MNKLVAVCFFVNFIVAPALAANETIQPTPGALDEAASAVAPKDKAGDLANAAEGSIILQQMAQDYAFNTHFEKKLAEFDNQVRVPFFLGSNQLDKEAITLIRVRIAAVPQTGAREILDAEVAGHGRSFQGALKSYLMTRNPTGELLNVPSGTIVATVFVAEHPATSAPNSPIEREYDAVNIGLYQDIQSEIAEEDEAQKRLVSQLQSDPSLRAKLNDFLTNTAKSTAQSMNTYKSNTVFTTIYASQNPITNEYSFLSVSPWGGLMVAGFSNSEEGAIAIAGHYLQQRGYSAPYDLSGSKLIPLHIVAHKDPAQITYKPVDFPASSWPAAISNVPKYRQEIVAHETYSLKQQAAGFQQSIQNVPQRQQPHSRVAPMRGPDGATFTGSGSLSGNGGGGGGSNCSPAHPCGIAVPLVNQ